MYREIRSCQNDYIQGVIFLLNLLLRHARHSLNTMKIQKKGVAIVTDWNFEKYKTSETLFILGSGASIADYADEQFNLIKRNDSVGFNFWLLHEFIPTFFTFEISDHSSRSQSLWKNLQLRSEDYRQVPVIFKYSSAIEQKCGLIPHDMERIFLATSLSIPGFSDHVFKTWLLFLQGKSFFNPNKTGKTILYRQASLSWLITFALYMGYKEIVLCGVDLNCRDYFYDRDDSYVRENNLELPDPGFVGEQHPTESGELSILDTPISKILKITKEVVLDKQGVNLWVGSSSSALYPDIPLYEWR